MGLRALDLLDVSIYVREGKEKKKEKGITSALEPPISRGILKALSSVFLEPRA